MTRRLLVGLMLIAGTIGGWVLPGHGQATRAVHVAVDAGKPGAAIPSGLFGVFFEDINFAADGGLYPERIKNRSFEFPEPLMGWSRAERGGAKGTLLAIERRQSSDGANRHYLRITADAAGAGFGAANEGFRGIGVAAGDVYRLSIRARRVGDGPRTIRATLDGHDGQALATADLEGLSGEWRDIAVDLTPAASDVKATFAMLLTVPGAVEVDTVSLFPRRTWKNRPAGLRADLVQLLDGLKPGFIRFPGGCIVEGRHLETRYQWKSTIGPVDERRLIVNRWNTENEHKAPDYFQSFGLGFFEYFQLSEDLGAKPLPILNCGMACQFNSSELAAMDTLDEYIQDALDLIEFANGASTTPWGRKRAAMGHPAPFNLTMIGIGNEQWGPQYAERFAAFSKVLRAKYPRIALVASSGPDPDGARFEFLWSEMRAQGADFVDEHYYRAPEWFLSQVHRYDKYPRTGPKVFAGEYAAHTKGTRRNNTEAALAEAAMLTGIERNADVVQMASYAPLFGHVDAWQWRPNLIWFDNLHAFGTPSYYVQQIFGANRGTHVLPMELTDAGPVVGSASLDRARSEAIVKLVNPSGDAQPIVLTIAGLPRASEVRVTTLGGEPEAENTLEQPTAVAPQSATAHVTAGVIEYTLAPHTLALLRVR